MIPQPTVIKILASIQPDCKARYNDWQARFNTFILAVRGFLSLEFLASGNEGFSWAIVQRFYDHESALSWQNSSSYKNFLEQLKEMTVTHAVEEKIETDEDLKSGITAVIITQVKPNQENAYREWSSKIHQLEAKFEGFRGFYIQSPQQNRGNHWITLLQFDTPANLDRWLTSPERKRTLRESSSLVSSFETHRMASPYAGWFYSMAPNEEAPSVWQQTMMVLLVLFPVVMLELKYLSIFTRGLDISLGTFIGNAISVALISFPLMPLAIKCLGWWLYPDQTKRTQTLLLGTMFVCFLYTLEIVLFWHFL